jgi:hypothetical protein
MDKLRWIWYAIIAICVALAMWVAPEIPFQSNPDAYTLIPEEDRLELEAFETNFESNGYPIHILVLKHDKKWGSYEDFQWMDRATKWWHFNDSLQTLSITNVPFPVQTFLGIRKKNFVPLESEKRFQKWYQRADAFEDITRKFLSKNRKYALLFVPSDKYSDANIQAFDRDIHHKRVTVLPLDYLAIENELRTDNQRETLILSGISFAIILLLFLIFTGSLKGLLFIASMIVFSLSLTTLFVYLTDMWFSIHMVAIPCMLIVLSFTDLMHLIYTHHKLRGTANSPAELRKQLGKSLHRPMILTSLTNMVGFVLFLILSDSPTLTDISLLSIVGVVFGFF